MVDWGSLGWFGGITASLALWLHWSFWISFLYVVAITIILFLFDNKLNNLGER